MRFFLLAFLLSCHPYKIFKKEYITLSESPCIDGTMLNIDQAGCEGFYWGTKPESVKLKIRCTYSENRNFWTEMDFYAIPNTSYLTHSNWNLYCEDRYIKMYAIPRGKNLESN